MHHKSFKATTIVAPDAANRLVLEAAFNSWSEETQPASILHVHYYHDPEARVRGYQVVYEEEWRPLMAPEKSAEDETASLLV
jgi:hypothetical protein